MTEEKKVAPQMERLWVDIKMRTTGNYREHWEIRSNIPGALKPATPVETAITAAGQLARYAAFYSDQGAEVIRMVATAVSLAHASKVRYTAVTCPDPRMALLMSLADDLGYDLIKKEPTDGPKADEGSGTPPGQPAGD